MAVCCISISLEFDQGSTDLIHTMYNYDVTVFFPEFDNNASVNYGKYNSVFRHLENYVPHLISANCNCHVIRFVSAATTNGFKSSDACAIRNSRFCRPNLKL
ncbi:hypothetical protein NQ317_000810 [Molorchus minor]|uniref:Uncharacterized protein n=1 Tax=Molorchus minor TaxID=1323400 RepID=A0ABQ9J5G5_9CUCU|nr:hypothetical protein NQ317_000810 [Molorchus minor]